MVGEAFAGLSIFKSLLDTAKSIKDMNDTATRQSVAIELGEKILAAREAQSALLERVSELEKEVAHLKAWDADKQRYKLSDAGNGIMTYTMKEGMENSEPFHQLCANCYNDGQKSVLQPETRTPGMCLVLVCNHCGADLYLTGQREPEHVGMRRARKSQ